MYSPGVSFKPNLINLIKRLTIRNIQPIVTERDWKNIFETKPFLYFRNAYVRFDCELDVAIFHQQHPDFPYILSRDNELISVSKHGSGASPFIINAQTYYYEPAIEPLPILLGTHRRPMYFRLTLNSLLHNLKSVRQKLYLVLSEPDAETLAIAYEALKSKIQVEIVLSERNLKYAFANFGTKFFQLDKFIHHEDDGIIPQNVDYHLPYWTQQLHHRSTTADIATFRIFEGNWTSAFWKSGFLLNSDTTNRIPQHSLWYYCQPDPRVITPIGGMGMVMNSKTMYKDFQPPNYNVSDSNLCLSAKTVCIANVPIYHIGANYPMDYPEYVAKKENTQVDRYQIGKNLRTGEEKQIDLQTDYSTSY